MALSTGVVVRQFVSAFHEGQGFLKPPDVPEHLREIAMGHQDLGVEADRLAERRNGAGPVPRREQRFAEVLVGEEVAWG